MGINSVSVLIACKEICIGYVVIDLIIQRLHFPETMKFIMNNLISYLSNESCSEIWVWNIPHIHIFIERKTKARME